MTRRSCRLYSWIRLICTSKSDRGSTVTPVVSAITRASLSLFDCLTARNSCWKAASFAHGVRSRRRSRSVIHRSPMVRVIRSDRAGLAWTQPPAGRDAVRLVVEPLRPEPVEIGRQRRLDEPAVKSGHAVDGVAADDAQVGHAHLLRRRFLDERHPLQAGVVTRPDGRDVLQEAPVDLVDDLQVPRHDTLEQGDGPLLERLRQQRVVRVRRGRLRDVPGGVPGEVSLVDQDAHQLGHGEGGMRVVELDGDLGRKGVEAAGVIPLVPGDDVAQRAGHEEVLLDQPQLLTRGHGVGRIEDLGDSLGSDLLFHGLHVVARVEDLHVEVT